MEVSGTSNAQQTSDAIRSANLDLTSDFDTFISLLTAQVTNQDPLEPVDSTQFVEQLATFSGLEQQVASNTHLEQIVGLLQNTLSGQGNNLLGKTATASSISASGSFEALPITAEGVSVGQLVVKNSSGQEVYRGINATEWSWDGTNTDGNAVPEGTYTFSIEDNGNSFQGVINGEVTRVITSQNGQEIGLRPNVTSAKFEIA